MYVADKLSHRLTGQVPHHVKDGQLEGGDMNVLRDTAAFSPGFRQPEYKLIEVPCILTGTQVNKLFHKRPAIAAYIRMTH